MIGSIRTPFFKYEEPLDDAFLNKITPFFSADEKILKTFKSFDAFAFFTNKKIVFTYNPDSSINPPHFEIEFIPYRSIKGFSLLSDDETFNVEITASIPAFLQFCFSNNDDAESFLKTLNQYVI